MDNYEYGQPIPKKYRSRLFVWDGGGYDGCFWEPNAGLVDAYGHWRPLYSSGYKGIDDGGWLDKKNERLKTELGYDITPARSQYNKKVHEAVREVFGKKWYEIETSEGEAHLWEDPRVLEKTKEDKRKIDEYEARMREYELERFRMRDQAFMDALERDNEDERPEEIGSIDDEHVKETCGKFCDRYKENVGFMAHILDGMSRLGYDAWCTCTDCGKQFENVDYESFSCMMDHNAYTGNGGIGVIMKRVLCEDCLTASECPCCHEFDIPNRNAKDGGEGDRENYDFFASVMLDWIGICWGCADGFFRDCAEKWSEEYGRWEKRPIGEKFDEIHERAKEKFGEDGYALYERMKKTADGRKMINAVRDLFEGPAMEYEEFKDRMDVDDEWLGQRLIEKDPEQGELPGMVDKQEEMR